MPFQTTDERLDRLEALVGQIIVAHEAAIRRLERLDHAVEQMRQEGELDRAEARRERVAMNKRWGELAMKMGTFVEDIVAPNIPRIARKDFGLGEPELCALRLKVRHPADPSRSREFDFVYAASEGWVVNETKSNAQSKDVDAFAELLGELGEYFPQYRTRPLYPVLSSLHLREEVVQYCTRQRIYAAALDDETLVVLNATEVRREGNAAGKD